MSDECIWSRLSFSIYFPTFCENHTHQSLSQNDPIMFLIEFCTILIYRWPIFLFEVLFHLNLFMGCVYHNFCLF